MWKWFIYIDIFQCWNINYDLSILYIKDTCGIANCPIYFPARQDHLAGLQRDGPKNEIYKVLLSNISTFFSKVVKFMYHDNVDFHILRGQHQSSTSLLNSCIV